MAKKQKSLAINAALNVTKTVLGIIFPVITYPYVSRTLGVNNMGIFNFSSAFISYFLLIAGLGVATYGIREGSAFREDKKKITQFISEIFTINVLATIISSIALIIIVFVAEPLDKYRPMILILSGEIIFTTLGVSWICNIFEDFYFIAVRTVAFQILSLILIFVVIKSSDDIGKYAWIVLLANSGANFLNFFYIQKNYCKFKITIHGDLKRHIKPILTIFSTNIAVIIYVSSDSTMLGLMLDEYHVGLYGTAVKIYTIIKNVLVSVLLVLIPRFSIMFSKTDNDNKAAGLFSNVFKILTFVMLPMCTGLFMVSRDMINIVFGKEYEGSVLPFKLLCIAVSFSLYAYLYIQCVLIPVKKESIVFKATAIGAVINVILNLILIPLFGIVAAAITTIIAEFITFIVVHIYARKLIEYQNVKASFFKTIFGCALIALICFISYYIEQPIIRLSISVIGSAIVYVCAMIILKNEAFSPFMDCFARVFKKILKRRSTL